MTSFLLLAVVLRITAFVALAVGLLRGPEFLRAGGDVEPEPLAGVGLLDEEALIAIGATIAAGLITSCE
jgi:hypothetical protein